MIFFFQSASETHVRKETEKVNGRASRNGLKTIKNIHISKYIFIHIVNLN